MDIREIPRLIFERRTINEIGPGQNRTLSGDGIAAIGRTDNGVWLRYENDGNDPGFSTDARIIIYASAWDAHARDTDRFGHHFAILTASIAPGRECQRHYAANCRIIESKITVNSGPESFDLATSLALTRELNKVVGLAATLMQELPIDNVSTCRTHVESTRQALSNMAP